MDELDATHGTHLDKIVGDAGMLKRPDVGSVGPEPEEHLDFGDSFDIYLNPFNGRDELMSGHTYEHLMERYGRFFLQKSPSEQEAIVLEDTWSWEHDTCDYPECNAPAPYRRYIDDQPRGHYCEEHMNQVANEHGWFWTDVAAAAEDADPLERDHSPAAIAEALAPVRHPARGEGEGE